MSTIIEHWTQTARGVRRAGVLLPVRAHEHYCAEHDTRWPCREDPCLRHDAAPCPQCEATP